MSESSENIEPDRQSMEIDIVGVGFGPAMGGFLTTLSGGLSNEDGTPSVTSPSMPGMPLQVICYERADDVGFGVSGVVTKARGIRNSFPELDPSQIPTAAEVGKEKLVYLLDPVGASRRSSSLRIGDSVLRGLSKVLPFFKKDALELPFIPSFLKKDPGLVFSIGQFNQWVAGQISLTGAAQIWPGTPVAEPIINEDAVKGVRLIDQGTDKHGQPSAGFMPGMDINAALTVVADGPVGAIGSELDKHFGLPEGHSKHEWAVGSKMVVDLRADHGLEPGTVFHTFGFPEPEIFGFMYIYPDNIASLGIFVPSTFSNPARTSYRYLQHWMMHPYIWQHLEGSTLRSWGAKSIQESGQYGEPHLAGDGYVRIGEGSGTTNVLTGSGVDEAWASGTILAEGVLELLKEQKPFTKENLEKAYVERRRTSWLEKEAKIARNARNGFAYGIIPGLLGMGLSGLTGGKLSLPAKHVPPYKRFKTLEQFYQGKISKDKIKEIRTECRQKGTSVCDALMDGSGWPQIPYDGNLLVSLQDALLLGGKVQAAPGYADHVVFLQPELCASCGERVCIEVCSGQAITNGDGSVPDFDREKCVHCGACVWNCSQPLPENPNRTNIEFRSGSGGLHSGEN